MRVTEHRRELEFAETMRYLLDDLYPEAERIRLVVDNLRAPILTGGLLRELLCGRGEAHV
jgi:hypothetical protein